MAMWKRLGRDALTVLPTLAAIAAIALQGPAADAAGQQGAKAAWTLVSWGGSAGNMQLFFIDRSEVIRAGDRVEIEAQMVREEPTEGGVELTFERAVIDCARRSSVTLEVRMFDRQDRLLHQIKGDGTPERYAEGSAWRILVDTVCEGSYPEEQTADPRAYAEGFFKA